MDIITPSLGFTVENLENFIREKLDRFDKQAKIICAKVTLFIGSDSNPERYYCEIRLEVPGKDHFGKRNGDSFERAIIDAFATLHNVVRKAKEKQIDKNQGSLT
jgi:ribosome-associated translation inhibitor RaiA